MNTFPGTGAFTRSNVWVGMGSRLLATTPLLALIRQSTKNLSRQSDIIEEELWSVESH